MTKDEVAPELLDSAGIGQRKSHGFCAMGEGTTFRKTMQRTMDVATAKMQPMMLVLGCLFSKDSEISNGHEAS